MKLLSLTLPGETPIIVQTPPGIPHGIKLGAILTLAIELMMVVGIILSLIFLMYGGLSWTQSKGDKETLDKSRRIILYAIIGLLVMAFSLIIVNVFTNALGVKDIVGP